MSLQIYVINRSVDTERLEQFGSAAAKLELSFTRINAFDGHSAVAPWFLYRDLIGDQFWGEDHAKPGALACFLSHIAAWRRLIADNVDMALICEDDAVLRNRLTELRTDARRNEGFDVIFANERMVGWRDQYGLKSDNKLIAVQKVIDRVQASGENPGENKLARAPGADGYLVSRSGAQKLLEAAQAHGITAGVDWTMLGLALSPLEGAEPRLAELKWLAPLAQETPVLNVLVAKAAVVSQSDKSVGGSVLNHSERKLISALKSQPAAQIMEEGEAPSGGSQVLTFPSGYDEDPVFQRIGEGALYEEPALEILMRWMPSGGVFVDIGAHVGTHSLFLLHHCDAKLAIPIESNRHILDSLKQTIEINGLSERVDLKNLGFGAWSDRGRKEQVGPKKSPSEARLREGFVEDVRVRPAHSLLREHAPDLIKIDTNGEEREVLKGLRRIIKRQQPLIAMDLTRPKSEKALPLLARLHYSEVERAQWLDGDEEKIFALFRHDSQMPKPR
jgi:FkbM family methyltransferase